ncbi:MAG: hypothetical protein ACLS43_01300 [Evtepia gabavorous]
MPQWTALTCHPGEYRGAGGESGCGKSVTALSVLGLVPRRPGCRRGVRFGDGPADLGGGALRKLRGNRIAMIFQDPMTSLNPVYPVGRQVAEVLRLHRRLDAGGQGPHRGALPAGGHPGPGGPV